MKSLLASKLPPPPPRAPFYKRSSGTRTDSASVFGIDTVNIKYYGTVYVIIVYTFNQNTQSHMLQLKFPVGRL